MEVVEEAVAAATVFAVSAAISNEMFTARSEPPAETITRNKTTTQILVETRKKRRKEHNDGPVINAITKLTSKTTGNQQKILINEQHKSLISAEVNQVASRPEKKQRAMSTRTSFDERMRQLAEYKKKHGNLLVPIRYKENRSLGKFVHNSREQYKLYQKPTPEGMKKRCSLTAERIRQLDAIGFVWSTERAKQQHDDWKARLQQLQAYKDHHGHCLVPHGYNADPSFAEWIHRQRTTYSSKVNEGGMITPIDKERIDQLKAVGFNFCVHRDKWMQLLTELSEYKQKHGDCQVPTQYHENPKLGRWVHTQRHQRRLLEKGKKSSMTQQRISLLDELGFSWEVRPFLERPRANWQERLEELVEHVKKAGNFLVDPLSMPQLHTWCQEQRRCLRAMLEKSDPGAATAKIIEPERVAALKAIGFTASTDLYEARQAGDSAVTTTTSSCRNKETLLPRGQ